MFHRKMKKGNKMETTGEVLDLPEAARRLRFSIKTVRRMVQSGELKAKKIRGEWRISPKALTDLMNQPEEVTP